MTFNIYSGLFTFWPLIPFGLYFLIDGAGSVLVYAGKQPFWPDHAVRFARMGVATLGILLGIII